MFLCLILNSFIINTSIKIIILNFDFMVTKAYTQATRGAHTFVPALQHSTPLYTCCLTSVDLVI